MKEMEILTCSYLYYNMISLFSGILWTSIQCCDAIDRYENVSWWQKQNLDNTCLKVICECAFYKYMQDNATFT